MPSRADTHDLDKLKRWQKDLEATPDDAPPVFAIFLVSGEDRAAHDVFRAFRAGFEESGLGFAHLVIFGQHGISETARRLQARFGLEIGGKPSLAFFSGEGVQPQIISLPSGEMGEDSRETESGWREALDHAVAQLGEGSSGNTALVETLRKICVDVGNPN